MSCITLLSDFGLQDASLASAKGILMQYAPHLPIIDISHLTEPYHVQQAAYILASSYSSFPQGAIHVLLFDVFSQRNPRLLLCEREGYYFLAPDNGLLPLAFNSGLDNVWSCFELRDEHSFRHWLHRAGTIIEQLQTDTVEQMGLQPYELENAPLHLRPKLAGNVVECHVIHIDRFENVVVNITRKEFEDIGKGRPFRIQFMRDEEITELTNHYSNVREGEKLCRFNATGYLEIAINRGKAGSLFGLRLHREQHVIYSTIKIFFE